MKLAIDNPNFSIVVPTGCNASCDFCFWEKSLSLGKDAYLSELAGVLQLLPASFKQCSITGGEPTTLEWLDDILKLASQRFEKVVLSSNGHNLKDSNYKHINHLNISRHEVGDKLNFAIFNTESIPDSDKLWEITNMANVSGVDVTLNCVLDDGFVSDSFIFEYIEYAKSVRANSVCFRKKHGTLEEMPVNGCFTHARFNETGCFACKSFSQYIDSMKVTWKYNLTEPTTATEDVYELVFNMDGQLSLDWERKKMVKLIRESATIPVPLRTYSNHSMGSCGSSGC